MKHLVSVSLGSDHRDCTISLHLKKTLVKVERIGVNGDFKKARRLFEDLDGQVDCFGLGGIDLNMGYGRQFSMPNAVRLVKDLKTPVVDGSVVRAIVDKQAVEELVKYHHLRTSKALQVLSVNRPTMAKQVYSYAQSTVFGDIMYGLKLPVPIRHERSLKLLSNILVPVLTHVPHRWIYPVGKHQLKRKPRFSKYFFESDIISGDTHYVLKYSPTRLSNKTILATTLIKDDFDELFSKGATCVISPVPMLKDRCFGTNVIEAILTSFLAKEDLGKISRYKELLKTLGFKPCVRHNK